MSEDMACNCKRIIVILAIAMVACVGYASMHIVPVKPILPDTRASECQQIINTMNQANREGKWLPEREVEYKWDFVKEKWGSSTSTKEYLRDEHGNVIGIVYGDGWSYAAKLDDKGRIIELNGYRLTDGEKVLSEVYEVEYNDDMDVAPIKETLTVFKNGEKRFRWGWHKLFSRDKFGRVSGYTEMRYTSETDWISYPSFSFVYGDDDKVSQIKVVEFYAEMEQPVETVVVDSIIWNRTDGKIFNLGEDDSLVKGLNRLSHARIVFPMIGDTCVVDVTYTSENKDDYEATVVDLGTFEKIVGKHKEIDENGSYEEIAESYKNILDKTPLYVDNSKYLYNSFGKLFMYNHKQFDDDEEDVEIVDGEMQYDEKGRPVEYVEYSTFEGVKSPSKRTIYTYSE